LRHTQLIDEKSGYFCLKNEKVAPHATNFDWFEIFFCKNSEN